MSLLNPPYSLRVPPTLRYPVPLLGILNFYEKSTLESLIKEPNGPVSRVDVIFIKVIDKGILLCKWSSLGGVSLVQTLFPDYC